MGVTGDAIYKRLQVHVEDLDPALNAGAQYWAEVQYVSPDDALAGNQNNNASIRFTEVEVAGDGSFVLTSGSGTLQQTPAIQAWKLDDPAVRITTVDAFGRYFLGARVTDLGNGRWHYEYAIQNLNADGARGFSVPLNGGTHVTNIGFHDVDYHSGEPYDGTDWPGVFDAQAGTVSWFTINIDEFTNALRWGTLYNFRFDADRPPVLGEIAIQPFFIEAAVKSTGVKVQTWVPLACDGDGTCDPGEDCHNCPGDCVGSAGFCGDGVCDPTGGEDCVSCPQDCNGQQSGNPGSRFCCGDGGGETPVDCTDPRCTAVPFACASPCCGDGFCDFGEGSCNCARDCGAPPPAEIACQNGADDDCDGPVDCADLDCCALAGCADGVDGDGDAVSDCDCNDTNPAVWARPGEVRDLRAQAATLLSWSPPSALGGAAVSYAVLRSATASDFGAAAVCLSLADPSQPQVTDAEAPSADAVFSYLVRAQNACPAGYGLGPLGADSSNILRQGRTCP